MAEKSVSDERIKGALAYFGWWITGIILLLTEKENKNIRFHAMQSTIIFGAITLLYYIGLSIVPIYNWLMGFVLSSLISPLIFILWLFLMWKAYNGEKYKLPYFGELAEKQLAKLK